MSSVALAVTSIIVTVASTAVGVMSSMASARAQQDMADYNAGVARNQAESIRRMGELEAQKAREHGRRVLSAQEAIYGASGVEVEGSPLLVMQDTAFKAARDVITAKESAKFNAGLAEATGNLYKMRGQAAGQAGMYSAGTSLLSGVGSAINLGYKGGLWGDR